MNKLTFTGHETFHCRHFWLKKGYDYLSKGQSFKNPDAVTALGVGKNMVMSINFWLKAFGINDREDQATAFANKIFNSNTGYDPFLEYEGTLWLLHYKLLDTNLASIYPLVFKEFRKSRVNSQFTTQQLLRYLLRTATNNETSIAENSLKNDIKVFIKTYYIADKNIKDMEDDLSSIFIDLNLITKVTDTEEGSVFQLKVSERPEIPKEIFYFLILDKFPELASISFDDIQNKIGDVFACSSEGTELKIQEISEAFKDVVYKKDAGRKEIQIKNIPNKWDILERYYNV